MYAADDAEILEAGLGALEQAWSELQKGSLAEERSVRRLASSLQRLLEQRQMEDLAALAQGVADAGEDELAARVPPFIEALDKLVARLPRQTVRILAVEDDPDLQELVRWILGKHGYRVQTARSVEEAREVIRDWPPDLILLDLILSEADGRDLLLELREDANLAAVPVVVLSSRLTPAVKAECFALGADKFLEKPVDGDVLIAAVSGTLRRISTVTQLAQDDPLTGVPNRAGFRRVFEQVRALLGREHRHLCLAVLDLDLLKQVNDQLGHPTGDAVLRELAQVLSQSLRDADVVGRWGGDEFVVLFPDTGPAGARRALMKAQELFQERLREAEYLSELGRVPTFSGGITEVQADQDLDEAVAEADRSLYRAKNLGGGSVAQGGEQLEPVPARVLVVEDDELDAALILRVLGRAGFDVRRARTGREALDMAADETPDLVVLDLWLPDLEGFEVLSKIRKKPRLKRVPVLILTATRSEDRVEKSFELGADDYLVKPLATGEFLARARRLLRR